MVRTNSILFAAFFASWMLQPTEKVIPINTPAVSTSVIDGPYVLYRNDSVFVKYIEDNGGVKSAKTDSMPVTMKNNITLSVNTDQAGKTFKVTLKSKLTNE